MRSLWRSTVIKWLMISPYKKSRPTGAQSGRLRFQCFRACTFWDGNEDLVKFRIDALWAWTALRPEWATRVAC